MLESSIHLPSATAGIGGLIFLSNSSLDIQNDVTRFRWKILNFRGSYILAELPFTLCESAYIYHGYVYSIKNLHIGIFSKTPMNW